MRLRIWVAERFWEASRAATPETIGAAKLVPLKET
jgi:hypothetical protein